MDVYNQVYLDYLSQDYKDMAKSRKYKTDYKLEEDYEKAVERKRKARLEDILLEEQDDDWDEVRMDIIGSNGNIGYE